MTTRRTWIKSMVVATGGATVSVATAGTLGSNADKSAEAPADPGQTGPAPLHLVQPLQPGSELGHGWSLASVGGIEFGASTLSLSNEDGRTAVIALCRRNEAGGSLAHTGLFDLVLLNGAQEEAVATEELLGRVVRSLAQTIEGNESVASLHEGFLTHADRLEQYGRGLPA